MTTENRDESEQQPRRSPKRTRGEPKLYLSYLPDGRGGPREDKGSVPLEVDVEAHIEERTDCEPGLYRIEKKRSGEFSGEVLFYSKDEADLSSVADSELDVRDIGPDSSAADIRRLVTETVSATLEARERRDRASMGQPPDPMQQFREMRELLKEERDSGNSNQHDPLTMLERFLELQKKLAPEPAEPADALTAKDRAQLMLVKETGIIPEFMRSMREMLRAPEAATEPQSLFDKALNYLSDWTPFIAPVVGPVVGAKISDVLSRVNVDALAQRMNSQATTAVASGPGAAVPGPPSAEADFLKAVESDLLRAMAVVVDCMTLDTDDSDGTLHVERAANAIREFVQNNPAVAAQVLSSFFAQSSVELVATLASQKPEWAYVAKLANAVRFIDDLKDALNPSDETDEAETPPVTEIPAKRPSANGAKPAASVAS